ncbi:putative aminoacyltransferase, E1 ubiquitin-activating enzyme [Medicago truncatula]|uniref:U-box domain-containing protein n=1 Tax=Medicago truncatula TaxID=3880 RepID=G7LD36_MEDTR|nr:U-box domain-containing protein 27 [Medicago truncatula]AET04675.1 plant U-box protein [Medicago truncatula]RHN43091.1 putative aminoacyltransferase, E1 ubiquitin-activating enzyme [Medicago truncatula]
MVRDDLCITVPSLFRCPISLDVMKSPVSLCTGVTYDRSSIQRWLDNGNNTCPATMQILQTKDFVPNRTLQRLIQIWSDSVRHRVDSPESPLSTESVDRRDQLIVAITDFESGSENQFDSLVKIVRFAKDSEENCVFLAKTEGFVCVLVSFLDNVDGGVERSVELLEQVVIALDLVLCKIENRESILKSKKENESKSILDSLLLVLQQGSCESKIASVRVLKFIAVDAESKLLVAEKEGLLSELLNQITPKKDQNLMENALSCLVAISTPKRNKAKLVHLGAVKVFSNLLTASPSLCVSVTEKVLKLLETVSSTKEGRSEICEAPSCVVAIVNKVLKVSTVATEHAVTILWSVCYLFRDQKAQEAVTKANGLTKILLLMQSNCSPQVRQMSVDLLKIFRVNSKSCLSSYDTKTTHIMPF